MCNFHVSLYLSIGLHVYLCATQTTLFFKACWKTKGGSFLKRNLAGWKNKPALTSLNDLCTRPAFQPWNPPPETDKQLTHLFLSGLLFTQYDTMTYFDSENESKFDADIGNVSSFPKLTSLSFILSNWPHPTESSSHYWQSDHFSRELQ